MPFESAYKQERSRLTVLLILAVCIAFGCVWAWVFFAQKPRVADGTITSIVAVPLHSELNQGGGPDEGYGGGVQKTDEMLVWVHFKMKNLTEDVPLYETAQQATLTSLEGQEQYADAQNGIEVAKARMLTNIQQVPGNLVPTVLTLPPGKSTDGLALFVFPITKQQWDRRRQFSVKVSFQWQRDLAMKDPHPAVSDMMPVIK